MITGRVDLYEYFGKERNGASGGYLNFLIRTPLKEIQPKLRPAILVVPGGGYSHLSGREGEPVAIDFLAAGYNAFVLEYSLNTAYPVPLDEACMAVSYIRAEAEKHCTDAGHVAAVGFSAGGHLAGLLATAAEAETAGFNGVRLNAVILSYPVVTMGGYTHEGSRGIISGGDKTLFDKLSVEKRVTKNSAPAFIWHTSEDEGVPVQNSLLLAEAYAKAKVPFSLRIFEKGWHGLSLSNEETCNQTAVDEALYGVGVWTKLAREWLKGRGFCVKVSK